MKNRTHIVGHRTAIVFCLLGIIAVQIAVGVQILSKSKLEKCEKSSDSGNLNCTKKVVLNMAVPSGSVKRFSTFSSIKHFSY